MGNESTDSRSRELVSSLARVTSHRSFNAHVVVLEDGQLMLDISMSGYENKRIKTPIEEPALQAFCKNTLQWLEDHSRIKDEA